MEVAERAPPESEQMFLDVAALRRSEKEMEEICETTARARPYWGLALACVEDARVDFFKALARKGLASYRRRNHHQVSVLFV